MIAMLNFGGLVVATIVAAAAAVACNWLMLCVAFHLMQPAAIRKTSHPCARNWCAPQSNWRGHSRRIGNHT
jgi:hypothetical protein